MEVHCPRCASFLLDDAQITHNQARIRWAVVLNILMMFGETIVGYLTKSMALTADGFHMASHAGALLITLLAYALARSPRITRKFSFGAGKLIPLGGYTSAVILGIVAILIFIECVERLLSPVPINFNEAIGVACLGMTVNLICAYILGADHGHSHGHSHEDHHQGHVHDHNIRSAFLHVVADAITSFLAVFALLFAKFYHLPWLDPVIGLVGACVILAWSFQLCRDTGWELLDGHSKTLDWKRLRSMIEVEGARIIDFHVWRIAPKAVACELVVAAPNPRGLEHYRELLQDEFGVQHVIVEERHLNRQPITA